jgi:hypothetical protein
MPDSPTERLTEDLARPFVVSGRRCYLTGRMDGAFPPMGHHLPGEMGGLWAPPIKLADGFWFGVSAGPEPDAPVAWMYGANCAAFSVAPGRAWREFRLPSPAGEIAAWQDLVAAEDAPGLLVTVTLENRAATPLNLTLRWVTRFDLQGAWWSGWPDRADGAWFAPDAGAILACDGLTPGWAAAMRADRAPSSHAWGPDLWGPEQTGSLYGPASPPGGILRNPEDLLGAGISGRLDFALTLAPGERQTITCCIAGATEGAEAAGALAADLLDRARAVRARKTAGAARVLAAAPIIVSPRPDLDRAFAGSALALDMLTFDMPGRGRGVVAGLPGFAWFFGCDTYYTVSGLLISGQAPSALANLEMLADYARAQGGRVPHEITQTGALFNPGNTVETGQYVTSVERAYRWTGDRDFLARVYDVCREGVFRYLLQTCDPHGDLLPDGPGMLELSTAQHGKKLDVACSLYQALRSLAYLAGVMGDAPGAERCAALAGRVAAQIDRYFWAPQRQEYVWRIEPDLTMDPDEPAHSYAALEMGVLDDAQAGRIARLFARIEGPEHTGRQGLIHPGTRDFVMPIQNAIVALAEFRYGRPDQGLWYLERMAGLYGHYTPWAIPEFIGADACIVQAWSSAAYNWLLLQGCFRLQPDPQRGVVIAQPQLPAGWDTLAARNLTIWGRRCDLRLTRRDGRIHFEAATGAGGALRFEVHETPALPVGFV